MPTFTVTIGYEWKTFCRREIQLEAESPAAAADLARRMAAGDSTFWLESSEGDGEAGPTEVLDVTEGAP